MLLAFAFIPGTTRVKGRDDLHPGHKGTPKVGALGDIGRVAKISQITDAPGLDGVVNLFLYLVEGK